MPKSLYPTGIAAQLPGCQVEHLEGLVVQQLRLLQHLGQKVVVQREEARDLN
jgi:hypothetical protein